VATTSSGRVIPSICCGPASTGSPPTRRTPAGRFTLAGYSLRLTAFNGLTPGSLHILFTDATSGLTTYQASRSLPVAAPGPDGTVTLDFNRAANLPCAYTEFATCPLPPPENRLPVAVEAGELIYQNDLWLDTYGTE
jgi:uncharacterized protein (DUF1684 family)